MNTSIDNIKWSDTGKRVDFEVEESKGDGFFVSKEKVCAYKLFVLGSEKLLAPYKNNENKLAEAIAKHRKEWLTNEGKRYYSFTLDNGINIRVYKSKYKVYE